MLKANPLYFWDLDVHTAYHEAGHATMLCLFDMPLKNVSIDPKGDSRGYCEVAKEEDTERGERTRVENWVMVYLAGVTSLCILRSGGPGNGGFPLLILDEPGSKKDLEEAQELLRSLALDEQEVAAYCEWLAWRVRATLCRCWSAVERVAAELLSQRQLSGFRVCDIVASLVTQPSELFRPMKGP